jgi:hypothetical protein
MKATELGFKIVIGREGNGKFKDEAIICRNG